MAGRKRKSKDEKVVAVTIVVPQETMRKLRQLKSEGRKFNKSKFFTEKFEKEFRRFGKIINNN